MLRPLAILLLLSTTAPAFADTIVLRDGTTRHGTILSQNLEEIRLRLNGDGIFATIIIPMDTVRRIIADPQPPAADPAAVAAAAPPTSVPLLAPPITTAQTGVAPPPSPPSTAPAIFSSPDFLARWRAFLADDTPIDAEHLPPELHDLWDAATLADNQGNRAQTLDAQRALEQAMRDLPAGFDRLEALSRHERSEGFGQWMARIHWDVLFAHYQTGNFDLSDIREPERAVLTTLLRDKSKPALEPLRPFFPPVNPDTGISAPFKPAQLQGINITNALDIKDKAAFAAAVLQGQIKIEPDMPAIDRQLLSSQLVMVNRVLSKARDLEPAARAALAKALRDRQAADDKARRNAAAPLQHAAMGGR